MAVINAKQALFLEVQNNGYEDREVKLIGDSLIESRVKKYRVLTITYEVKAKAGSGSAMSRMLRYAVYIGEAKHASVSGIIEARTQIKKSS